MNAATLCSGIGAPECAMDKIGGFRHVFTSEIEKFPSAVLAHHWPDVPNRGDMTAWRDWPVDDLDLLIAGTPCQAFSVAGARAGLDDARGNLTLEFVKYANRIRPRFVLWENVPGVLSDKTNAFGCLLAGLVGSPDPLVPRGGRWTNEGVVSGPLRQCAWRILDAQFFGVAQRRRRVWLLAGDLERGAGDWRCARALFPVGDCVRGDSAAGRAAGEEVAGTLGGGSGNRGWCDDLDRCGAFVAGAVSSKWAKGTGGPAGDECYNLVTDAGVAATLTKHYADHYGRQGGNNPGVAENHLVCHTLRGDGLDASEDGTGRGTPLVVTPILEVGKRTGVSTTDPRAGAGIGQDGDPMFTLQAGHQHAVHVYENHAQDSRVTECSEVGPTVHAKFGTGGGNVPLVFDTAQITSPGNYSVPKPGDPAPPLNTAAQHHVAFGFNGDQSEKTHSMGEREEQAPTLRADGPAHAAMVHWQQGGGEVEDEVSGALRANAEHSYQFARIRSTVRRLTPRECERLQGFPDDHTAVQYRNKPAADGPRYKAIGNSMAVPCVEFILRNLRDACNE